MEKDGTFYHDAKSKAEAFNEAFLKFSSIDSENANLPNFEFKTNARLSHLDVTEEGVINILKSLDCSKATGSDGISAKMLYSTAKLIAPSLTKLIKLSLSISKVPIIWKQANVLPLFKKDDKSDFTNYRPVSLLNITSKVCEKVVFKHVFNYIRDNNLITLHQSSFTPGDSIVHQLVYYATLFAKR